MIRHILTLITVVILVPVSVKAQTGGNSVALRASVSETVNLSVPPNLKEGDVDIAVMGSGNTVRMTLSGGGAGSLVIRVPLIVRSNSSFKISGTFESTTAQLTRLSVSEVRATGALVSPEAVTNVDIPNQFDLRGQRVSITSENGSSVSGPFVVLSGPRVSLGGTLNSSNNALEITLLIRIKPESVGSWLAHLTFFNH